MAVADPIPFVNRKTLTYEQVAAHQAAEQAIADADTDLLREEMRALRLLRAQVQLMLQQWGDRACHGIDPRNALRAILRTNSEANWPIRLDIPVRTLLDIIG